MYKYIFKTMQIVQFAIFLTITITVSFLQSGCSNKYPDKKIYKQALDESLTSLYYSSNISLDSNLNTNIENERQWLKTHLYQGDITIIDPMRENCYDSIFRDSPCNSMNKHFILPLLKWKVNAHNNWSYLLPIKQNLYGTLKLLTIHKNEDAHEIDWNLYIVPDTSFYGLIDTAKCKIRREAQLHNLSFFGKIWAWFKDTFTSSKTVYDWQKYNERYTIVGEFTPSFSMLRYHSGLFNYPENINEDCNDIIIHDFFEEDVPSSNSETILGENVIQDLENDDTFKIGVYGPFLQEGVHYDHPEIHPVQAFWYKTNETFPLQDSILEHSLNIKVDSFETNIQSHIIGFVQDCNTNFNDPNNYEYKQTTDIKVKAVSEPPIYNMAKVSIRVVAISN